MGTKVDFTKIDGTTVSSHSETVTSDTTNDITLNPLERITKVTINNRVAKYEVVDGTCTNGSGQNLDLGDLPGSEYTTQAGTKSPSECATICDGDSACTAW